MVTKRGSAAVAKPKKFATEQEGFWAGGFGDNYINRNAGDDLVVYNVTLFGEILKNAPGIESILELGCNIGLNLEALKKINNNFSLTGYEINPKAAKIASDKDIAKVICGSILEDLGDKPQYDLTFTKAVLIHINPEFLNKAYDNLYKLSKRYIIVCEYYNPTPIIVNYRGNTDRLFKRDFAGDLIDRFGMRLINYGFAYHRDNYAPQDDVTWFLLEK